MATNSNSSSSSNANPPIIAIPIIATPLDTHHDSPVTKGDIDTILKVLMEMKSDFGYRYRQCIEMEIQERLELEDQKKIAASTIIQHWHRRITFRQLELEQQFQVHQQLDLDALEEQKRVEFKLQQRLDLEEQHHMALELGKRVDLEIQQQLKLEEQKKTNASITIQKWHRGYMLRCLELGREQFKHLKDELCLTTNETTIFRRAESSPSFLHLQQSCELTATGLPFHMSAEMAPSPSIWNTDQQTIYYRPPSLPPPEPPPITPSHGFGKKLVGLFTMGGSLPYWKLGIEILDYCAEETLIGTYLCKRL